VMKLLVNRSCRDRSRMADLAVKGVVARLASIILDLLQSEGVVTHEGHYRIVALYTQEQLAIMIGAKRVAVTRGFKTLHDSGCVHLLKRQIHVTDLGTLRGWAMGR
jgi:CRP/FNR family transcriptional regulator, cyclic AMP receptor protein